MNIFESYELTKLFTWRDIFMISLIGLCSEPIQVNSYFYNSDISRE